MAKLLPTHLGGAAFSYWDSLPDRTKCNYTAVKDKLKTVFGQTAYMSTFQSYINACTRLPGEALPVFAAEISRLVEETFPTYGQNAKVWEKFRRFIAGIEPYLQVRCHEQGLNTLDSALQFAIQIENARHASRLFSTPNTLQSFSRTQVLPAVSPVTTTHLPTSPGVHSATSDDLRRMQSMLETLTDKVEKLQLEVQRQQRSPLRGSSDYRPRQRSYTPDRERGRSHYHPADRQLYGDSSYDRYSAREDSHRATRHDRDRYNRRDTYTHPGSPELPVVDNEGQLPATDLSQAHPRTDFTRDNLSVVNLSSRYVSVVIENTVVHAFADTGADVSVISEEFRMSTPALQKKQIVKQIIPLLHARAEFIVSDKDFHLNPAPNSIRFHQAPLIVQHISQSWAHLHWQPL